MATSIVLILLTILSLLNLCIGILATCMNFDRMRMGGRRYLIPTVLTCVFSAVQFGLCMIALVEHMTDREVTLCFMATAMFISTVQIAFLMRSRKIQNDGMTATLNRETAFKMNSNRLMSGISHEIRTPMNTIVGLTEVLSRRENLPPDVLEDLENISSAGASLLAVVNNLIDYTKIQSDKLDIISDDYDTKNMILEIIRRTTSMMKASSVEFLADIDSDIPAMLRGDDVRLIQAVINLISNSCKFTNVGVITFRMNAVRNGNDALLRMEIEDTGVGMSEENKNKLFAINETMEANIDRTNKGAGLGLLITKNIIERMGGSLSFASEEGAGTTVTLTVKQGIVSPEPIGEVQISTGSRLNERYQFTAPMAKVLVVDDNIVNLFVAKEILTNYEIDVQTASSGFECLQMLAENYFDIVFMDYVMPDLDGHDTLLRIRSKDNDFFKRVPVVALTAQIVSGSGKVYMDEGFQGYISKPININELEDTLLRLLPEEYICHKDKSENKKNDEPIETKAWYKRFCTVLKDFNVKKALAYSNNDYTAYLNLLRVIYNDSFSQASRIRSYVETDNIESYKIAVHAMKSVSASAGADNLSLICKEHEDAAKKNDVKYIRDNVELLLSAYDSFLQQIESLLQRESEMMRRGFSTPRADVDESNIKDIAQKLYDALEDYNIDDAEQFITELSHVNLSLDREKAVENAKDILMLFKYDEAAVIIKDAFL